MNKHTPGPWSVDSVDMDAITSDYDGELVCEIAERETVDAKTGQWITCEATIAANAHLIAAAPAMYEALKGLLGLARYIDQSATHEGLTNCDLLAKARQALTQAEGKP